MQCRHLPFIIGILFAVPMADPAEDSLYILDTLIVTGYRAPVSLSKANHSITVIDRETIESAPAQSLAEILEYAGSVDSRQRGAFDGQSDISIRGGTFEQTLVLIDGIKMSDPQTGHHIMNLPIAQSDIDRIEVLNGPGSRQYGPNAFGGVINIITRKQGPKSANIFAGGGENGLLNGGGSVSIPFRNSFHRFSAGKIISSGYIPYSDFNISCGSYASSIQTSRGTGNLLAGYTQKKFGANTFYVSQYPREWEQTNTGFIHLMGSADIRKLHFDSKLYYRHNMDDFILDKTAPSFSRNQHTTATDGAEFSVTAPTNLGVTSFGAEGGNERIQSASLGDHERMRGGLFAEHQVQGMKRCDFSVGAFSYYYSGLGWKTWPGADFGFKVTNSLRLYSSYGRSFRMPTFTELYYNRPGNMGNPALLPEKSIQYELGLKLNRSGYQGGISIFNREGYDIIDWVRPDTLSSWKAKNHTAVNTNGFETRCETTRFPSVPWVPITRIGFRYTYLETDKKAKGFYSKYALDYLRHQAGMDITCRLAGPFSQTFRIRYEERIGNPGHTLLDSRVILKLNKLDAFLEATNIMDTQYQDIGSVQMPGRWIRSGVSLKIYE